MFAQIYADDTQVYHTFILEDYHDDVLAFQQFLVLNSAKSVLMPFGNKRKFSNY